MDKEPLSLRHTVYEKERKAITFFDGMNERNILWNQRGYIEAVDLSLMSNNNT